MNALKITFMMALLMALFIAGGFMVGGQSGAILAFVLAAVMNFATYWYSDKLVLKLHKSREITEADHPALYRVVRRVTTQADQMPMPRIYISAKKEPNAFATGRNIKHAAVAVTEGLLELLNEDELEGVVGHEIAHIRNNDMLIGTIAATFAGAIGILASIARWGAIFGGYGRDNDRGGGIGLIAMAIVAPLAAMVIQMAISRNREYKADAESGRITGKYLALASALEKLHKTPQRMRLDRGPAMAHLMIANPLSGRGFSKLFSTHPPVEKRVAKLQELSQHSVYAGFS